MEAAVILLMLSGVLSAALLLRAQANHMIEQSFEFVAEGDKYGALARLLEREMDGSRLLIFCETKRGCDSVTRQLRTEGWPALSIHGDKSQQERDWVLAVGALLIFSFHLSSTIWGLSRSARALYTWETTPSMSATTSLQSAFRLS